MKLIRYTLLPNGTIPDYVIDGGHFAKLNSNDPPQDNDLIGFSESNTGLEEYTVKSDFENYVKSLKIIPHPPIAPKQILNPGKSFWLRIRQNSSI